MTSFAFFLALLTVIAASRLIELAIARRRLAASGAEVAPDGNYRAMVLVHILLFLLPPLEVWALARPFIPALAIPALIALAAATALRAWVIRSLGPSWNTRGLVPAEARVVTGGPYRWLRHPNYLAVIVEIAALPLVHGALVSAVLLSLANAAVLAVRIPREEAALFELDGYARAFADKRRLLPIPGRRR